MIPALLCVIGLKTEAQHKTMPLFNGKDFTGWEGDTVKLWRVENGVLIGGSLIETVPENNFLCTRKSYDNFILKTKFKLLGSEGFINGGVQFRSKRLSNPPNEMEGYQADLGDGYWASIYDESRRNKTLTPMDTVLLKKLVKKNDWNDYEVRAEGRRIRVFLNGKLTADYTEPDVSIPQTGIIGLQIHGGGKAEIHFKDMRIQELN
ncbi:MAG: DUF1080 domain-containing protein [Chitinophagaceae bacterium]|nr:DUF1080 domain-containing protein [Chitinophagaceae bacterium]